MKIGTPSWWSPPQPPAISKVRRPVLADAMPALQVGQRGTDVMGEPEVPISHPAQRTVLGSNLMR